MGRVTSDHIYPCIYRRVKLIHKRTYNRFNRFDIAHKDMSSNQLFEMAPKPQKKCHVCHLHYSLASYDKHVKKCEEMYNIRWKGEKKEKR